MANIDAVTTFPAVLGAVLVKLRTEKGMKQGDLAAAIGLGASTWSRIEKGDSGLSIDQLRLVAKALDVTPGLILEMVEASEKEVSACGVRIEPSWPSRIGKAALIAGPVALPIPFAIPVVGSALSALIAAAIINYRGKSEK